MKDEKSSDMIACSPDKAKKIMIHLKRKSEKIAFKREFQILSANMRFNSQSKKKSKEELGKGGF